MRKHHIAAIVIVALIFSLILSLLVVCVSAVGRILWTKPEAPEITGDLMTPTSQQVTGKLNFSAGTPRFSVLPGKGANTSQVTYTYHIKEPLLAVGVPGDADNENVITEPEPEIEGQNDGNSEALTEPEPLYTEQELELLAIVIYCEAGSDTITNETRRMVGEVVLNRVASDLYPDTIEAVLTQRGQYGRFYWTGVVWPARASRSVEAHAVERAYDCAKLVFEGERLLPEDVIYQAGFRQGHECVAHAPGFYFCR